MATQFPTFSQMPQGSYPMNAHPFRALVGIIGQIIAGAIRKVNSVFMSSINRINSIAKTDIKGIDGVQN